MSRRVGQMTAALRAMRWRQWSKNGLVVLAAVFARTLVNLATVERVAVAFFAFSLAASAIYIVNDIADRAQDRSHPRKRYRPIASGALGIRAAWVTAALCTVGAAALCGVLLATPYTPPIAPDPFAVYGGGSLLFVLTLILYIAQNVAYSLWLKHLVLWDVFSIAFGFVLRALAGAFAVEVFISPWFYLCAIFLSLFLALGKRRAELAQATATAGATLDATRKNLSRYTLHFLDQLMIVVVTCAVMAYSLYTFQGEASSHRMMVTIPFVIFGVSRYMYLVYVKCEGERPDEVLFQDKQILGAVALCALVVVSVLYGPQLLALVGHAPH